MENQRENLDENEQETLAAAVASMLASCPFLPSTITARFEDMDAAPGQIGIFPQSGSVYLQRFISGAFIGQYAFQLLYRVGAGADDNARADAENLLGAIAEWLEGKNITYKGERFSCVKSPKLSAGRTLQSIERTSTAGLLGVRQDGSLDYSITLNLTYTKR